jgi:ABC-2 type transport system permease protein
VLTGALVLDGEAVDAQHSRTLPVTEPEERVIVADLHAVGNLQRRQQGKLLSLAIDALTQGFLSARWIWVIVLKLKIDVERFLVVTRYTFKHVFRARFLIAYYVTCFLFPLGCAVGIYLNNNLRLLRLLDIRSPFDVGAGFFFYFLSVQGFMAFILTALVGPGLVSPDLANNALPLYFGRPFSRAEYILGKMFVLVSLLSLITWIPGLVLFILHSSLTGGHWMWANLWIAGSLCLGSGIEILVFSLLALALSAWIKRRPAAGAALLGVFFLGAGLAQTINSVLGTEKGSLIDLANLLARVEHDLFRQHTSHGISAASAWAALVTISAFCLWLLVRKLKAYEVVRG